MSKAKLEYIWLDGYKPTQSLRSKTMVVSDFGGTLEDSKMWSFDGSSTEQADGNDSDCLLKPVALYPDPDKIGTDNWLVMCEVLNADGTPHESNGRATINDDDDDFWFGFEQEYVLWDNETMFNWLTNPKATIKGTAPCQGGGTSANPAHWPPRCLLGHAHVLSLPRGRQVRTWPSLASRSRPTART